MCFHLAFITSINDYYKAIILKMFNRLRKWNDGKVNTYPPALGEFKISHVRDLTTGYDSREPDLNAVSSI